MITKSDVLAHFETVAKAAAFFGVEVQAIYQWKEVIPHARELELMVRLPRKFGTRSSARRRRPATGAAAVAP